MKLGILTLAAVGLFWPTAVLAGAGFKSGNELYSDCSAPKSSSDYAFCAGYVAGMTDTLQVPSIVCLPEHVTIGQSVDVVMKYLRNNPENRHYAAASVGLAALKQAFPCAK